MVLTCLEAYKRMTGVNNKLCNAILTPTLSNKTMHIYKSTKENVSSGATRTRV